MIIKEALCEVSLFIKYFIKIMIKISLDPSSKSCEDVVNNTSFFPKKYPFIKLDIIIKGINIIKEFIRGIKSLLCNNLFAINDLKVLNKNITIIPIKNIIIKLTKKYFLPLFGEKEIKYDKTFGNEKEQMVITKINNGLISENKEIAFKPIIDVRNILDNKEKPLPIDDDNKIKLKFLVSFFIVASI